MRQRESRIPTHRTVSGSATRLETISTAYPITSRQRAAMTEPPTMKGRRRRPHLELDRSATTPTTGCMINPNSGPAIHTSEVRLLVRPSCRR